MARAFECAHENCPFTVRAADETTVVAMARKHVRDRHGRSIETDEVACRIDAV